MMQYEAFSPSANLEKKNQYAAKVLLLCTSNDIGGTERVVQSLARGLSACGIAVETIIPAETGKEKQITGTIEWHRQEDVEVVAAPEFSRKNKGWHNICTLTKFLRARKDVQIVNIHYTQNISVSLTDIIAIRLAGKKAVVMVHHPIVWNKMAPRQYRIVKAALSLSAAVVGTTGCMAALLNEAGVAPERIVTIPLGVAPPKVTPSKVEARKQIDIPIEAFVVCSLSRLVEEKGIFELMEAFSRLPPSAIPSYLIIAGEGPDRKAMEQRAAKMPNTTIRFLGRVENVSEVYAAADVFALPSYWEGFGLVYIEAAFHGLPSIGTNVGGIPYVISDEKTGLLVSPQDIEQLRVALQRLREQEGLRLSLGQAAQKRANTEFTEEEMTQRFHTLFQSISNKR
jgi:teichuronic acid biosynthesis glycosyltransferase TuaC